MNIYTQKLKHYAAGAIPAVLLACGLSAFTPGALGQPSTLHGDNFDGYAAGAVPGGFSKNGSGALGGTYGSYNWTVFGSGTNKQYRGTMVNNVGMGGGIASAIRGVPFLGGLHLKNFTISSTMTVQSFQSPTTPGATSYEIGLVAHSASQPITVSGKTLYWASVNRGGTISLRSSMTGTTGLTLGSATNLSGGLVTGTTYTFTLQGTYVGSTLNLNFTVTGGPNTASITATTTAPLTGFRCGYACKIGPASASATNLTSLTVDADDFNVSVPLNFTEQWADHFDGTTLNSAVWSKGYRWADIINSELQAMRPENVSVSGGTCKIYVEKRTSRNMDMGGYQGATMEYSSGAIQTYNKWVRTYGYFEARIKMPSGKGTWPAFWLLPDRGQQVQDQYGLSRRVNVGDQGSGMGAEIDVTEYMGAWKDTTTGLSKSHSGYIWQYGTNGQADAAFAYANDGYGPILLYPNAETAFHTYGVYWEPGIVTFYLDGKVVYTAQSSTYVPNVPSHLILNCSLTTNTWGHGGTVTLADIDAALPTTMEVDYVKYYTVTVPSGAETTRLPVADAFVRDGSYQNSYYGSDPSLTVKLDTSSYNRESYLRFSAAGLASAPSVKLRLVPTSMGTQGSTTPLRFEFVASDSWTEGGINWVNKPAGSSTAIATPSGPYVIGQPLEIDVTPEAHTAANGDGLLSIRIRSTLSGSERAVAFGSKEHATAIYRPVLVY